MPKSKTTFNSKIETYLASADLDRFLSVCRTKRTTRAAIAREAIRFYLDCIEQNVQSKRDTELSISIKNMTDRICGMLARQGAQTGTLYELAWQNHVENKFKSDSSPPQTRRKPKCANVWKTMSESLPSE